MSAEEQAVDAPQQGQEEREVTPSTGTFTLQDKHAILRYRPITNAECDGAHIVTNRWAMLKMEKFCEGDNTLTSDKVAKKWRDLSVKRYHRLRSITAYGKFLDSLVAVLDNDAVFDCALLALFEGCEIWMPNWSTAPAIFKLGREIVGVAMPMKVSKDELKTMLPAPPTREEILETIACPLNGWYGATEELMRRLICEDEEKVRELEASIKDEVSALRAKIAEYTVVLKRIAK